MTRFLAGVLICLVMLSLPGIAAAQQNASTVREGQRTDRLISGRS